MLEPRLGAGKGRQSKRKGNELPVSEKAQDNLLRADLGEGQTALPRQLEVPPSTETISPQVGDEEQQEKMPGSQPEFCREQLSVENWHLLGSWSLAFWKPQPAFPVTLAPKVVCDWRNTYSAGRLTRVWVPALSPTSAAWTKHFTSLSLSVSICKLGV